MVEDFFNLGIEQYTVTRLSSNYNPSFNNLRDEVAAKVRVRLDLTNSLGPHDLVNLLSGKKVMLKEIKEKTPFGGLAWNICANLIWE